MIWLLRRAASAVPEQDAVRGPAGSITWAELLTQAEAVAGKLARDRVQRFALLDENPAHVIAALSGAALAGAEACVYPLNAADDLIGQHLTDFEHEVLFTSRQSLIQSGPSGVAVHPSVELWNAEPMAAGHDPDPADRSIMVMTTGTTGKPKGVLHTWDRLLAPVERIKPSPDHIWILAYGLNQFGGLQILIHVLAAQATLIATDAFSPKTGLAAIREHGVTHASGTPTYWRFLLAEMGRDTGPVPDLRQVTLSGEVVPGPLLEQVKATFPNANISQIYAATEFGQGISVRDGLPGLPVSMLESDDPLTFKVVDGELFVRSNTRMSGYYGAQAESADPWKPTGDLVEIVDDRVIFQGRASDVINVGGVKVHPLPIEEKVLSVPGVAHARVFGRENAMVGAIVAVEAVADDGVEDTKALTKSIRDACAELPPAARPRSIKFVEALATTQNKVSRREAKTR